MRFELERDYLIDLVQRLVRIRSINSFGDEDKVKENNEIEVSKLVENELKEAGIHFRKEEAAPHRPVVIAEIGGGKGRTLMLNAHMDTVDIQGMTIDPFSGEVKDGRIYGRGSTDTKASLGAMIGALKAVSKERINGKCIFTAVCDEEDAGLGTRYIASRIKADAAVIGEPTKLGIGIAQPGGMKFKITTRGRSTHGCTPYAGVNAIEKMAGFVAALPETVVKSHHSLIGHPACNIGQIQGGTDPSIVPDLCEINCDRRLLPEENPTEVFKEIGKLIERLKREDSQFNAKIEPPYLGPVAGFELSRNEPVVKAASRAYKTVTSREAKIIGTPYAADGMYLYQKGIPSITFGPGDVISAHSKDESIKVESIFIASKIYYFTILNFCS